MKSGRWKFTSHQGQLQTGLCDSAFGNSFLPALVPSHDPIITSRASEPLPAWPERKQWEGLSGELGAVPSFRQGGRGALRH